MAKNKMLEQLEARYERKYRAKFDGQMSMTFQMAQDAAMIACEDVFGLGPDKAEEFRDAYVSVINDMAGYLLTELNDKNATEFVYTKEIVDNRLRKICGDKFVEWDKRYGVE